MTDSTPPMDDDAPFDPSSRSRLTSYDRHRFPGETLFDRVGRAVCDAGCLPRKELFEAWEVAKRVRRRMRGGRVLDMAAGHGLLAWLLLLLDASSPEAICVDPALPPSSARITEVFTERWPRLAGRVRFVADDLGAVPARAGDLVACVHGCGALTDRVIALAAEASARVALLPCCHDLKRCETGRFEAWMPGPLAVDVERVHRLRAHGYRVHLTSIPEAITPQNRLILGEPAS